MVSPPAVMCAGACLAVLVLADYRVGEDALSAAMRPPDSTPGSSDEFSFSLNSQVSGIDADYANNEAFELKAAALRLDLPIDPNEMLVPHDDSGAWTVVHAAAPLETRVRVAAGEIVTTFSSAAASVGVPETVASQVADALGWEFDFNKDLEPGARFRIVYEERVRHGQHVSGRLLAVELQSGGKWREAYYYVPVRGGEGGYFDAAGGAVGRRFLRYPVAYTRISSRFAARRFHPVLRVHRPHYGVDFAAPTGTPVRAVASGKVSRAGWYGSSGRVVKLRHDGRYESGYAHLSRIAPGIRPGVRVAKGDTIGYVGQSGAATGPHLHFALYIDGRYADPFKVELPRARSLHGRRLAAFHAGLTGVNRMLAAADRPPLDEPIVTAALVN